MDLGIIDDMSQKPVSGRSPGGLHILLPNYLHVPVQFLLVDRRTGSCNVSPQKLQLCQQAQLQLSAAADNSASHNSSTRPACCLRFSWFHILSLYRACPWWRSGPIAETNMLRTHEVESRLTFILWVRVADHLFRTSGLGFRFHIDYTPLVRASHMLRGRD